ncbi:Uncharacterised protein [uncultured archaeon]|nr:Uncharacterised protein [uncultured archaeon]
MKQLLVFSVVAIFFPQIVAGECLVNGNVTCDKFAEDHLAKDFNASFTDMGGIGLLIVLLSVLLSFTGFAFWVWMIVDCIKRKDFSDKLLWTVVLLLSGFVGGLIYYFTVKKKDRG